MFGASSVRKTAGLSWETGKEVIRTTEDQPGNGSLLIGPDQARNFNERNALRLALKSERSGNCSMSRESVQVGPVPLGHGQLCAEKSVLTQGRNGTAWEEPGCAFLKTSFSF